ncbi:hypothetical protein FHW19_004248 [Ochrobactrum anthropi]|uniref:ribbon-helix-helix protein, CopG family n=1 Tax=Brucella anthropi TaxID=529 RepID=UPI0015FCC528|nr:ribbon-helix-helix protein, CopG family [Brucella anthropi]MBA8862502.1 hypothetical protein [Brucella anthropi]
MAKGKVTLSDFPVASRRRPTAEEENNPNAAALPAAENAQKQTTGPSTELETRRARPKSQFVTPDERRANDTQQANQREDSRNRLRELRRNRERESKHFVNVSLDYDTKRRLEKAAHDNGLKMSVILRDAIDQYLTENGY